MSARTAITKIQGRARAAKPLDNPFVEALVRGGYVARGLIYSLVGLVAVGVAFEQGGTVTDQSGAIAMLASQPFGKIIMLVLAVGLLGYSFWGFVRAVFDPLGRGHDTKGILERVGFFASGLSYGSLAAVAMHFATGMTQAKASTPQDMSATFLEKPYGPWIVAVLGVVWLGAAAGQLYTSYKADFKHDLKSNLPANEKLWAERLGRAGYAARGIVFGLVGWFLIQSAMQVNPKQAVGLDGALLKLAEQPFGVYLLAAVALGLLAFGIYSILCARWIVTDS